MGEVLLKPGFWLRNRVSWGDCVAEKPGFEARSRASLIAVLALLLTASTASAGRLGNIEVTVEHEPKGNATHGYAEVWVRVKNHSEQTAHSVRVTFPKSSYSPGVDHLRAVTRAVTVEPGKVARVSIAFPERLAVVG